MKYKNEILPVITNIQRQDEAQAITPPTIAEIIEPIGDINDITVMAVGNFPGKTNCAAIGVEEGNINPKPIDAPILNIKTPGNEVSNCGMTNRKLNKANKNEPKMTN